MSTRTRRGTKGTSSVQSTEAGTSERATRSTRRVASEIPRGAVPSNTKVSDNGVGSKVTGNGNKPKGGTASSAAKGSNESHQLSILSQYSQLSQDQDENLVIFFVLPEGTTEATCDPNLFSAYLLCQDNNLKCKWLSEQDCLTKDPKQRNVFVLAPFEGPAFSYLQECRKKCNFEIIGPQCIKYSIQGKEDYFIQTRGHPAYTMGMRDTLITLSGVSPETRKKELATKVQLMNGNVSSSFTSAVTHVVADNLLTEKCNVAYSRGIPVMTVDWIEAVWNDSQNNLIHATDSAYAKYSCPVFHKLVICVSSVTADMKKALKNAIEAHGGEYSADMIRNKTSILVVPKDDGQKYRYAQQWKLPCVLPDWVEASKSAGHVLPLKRFTVRTNTSTPINSMVAPPGEGNLSIMSNIGSVESRNAPHATFRADESDINHTELEEALKKAALHGPYLDGCRIYFSGLNKLEQVRKFLNSSGATRLDRLTENVTHVVVTDRKIPAPDTEVLRLLDPRPHVLTLDWLTESAKKGYPVDEDAFLFESSPRVSIVGDTSAENTIKSQNSVRGMISDLVERKSKEDGRTGSIDESKSSSRSQGRFSDQAIALVRPTVQDEPLPYELLNDNGIENDIEAEVGQNNHFVDIAQDDHKDNSRQSEVFENLPMPRPSSSRRSNSPSSEDSDATRDPSSQDGDSVFVFTGRRIKIAIDDEDEKSALKTQIQEGGGSVVDDRFDIIILPPIYAVDLKVPVNKTKRYTKQWVNDCMENGTLDIDEFYYHRPRRAFDGMFGVLSEVVVAISQYPNPEKEYLSSLVTAMGGKPQDVFARKTSKASNALRTTHLICPTTSNEKFRAAKKWGTPVVVADWVMDCYKNKRLMGIDPYNPELRNDSDSILSYMPHTPQHARQKGTAKKPHTSGAITSVISNYPPSSEKQPINFQNVKAIPFDPNFKVPANANDARSKKFNIEEHKTDSFYEFVAAGGGTVDKKAIAESASFIEFQAQQRELQHTPEAEKSLIMDGFTKSETRRMRIGLEIMALNSPEPQGIPLKKRNSTPISVMTARTWKEIMAKPHPNFLTTPECSPFASPKNASTPNFTPLPVRRVSSAMEVAESAVGISRIRSERSSNSSRGSVKRSSDSSLEDEDVNGRYHLGQAKKRKISSESETSDQHDQQVNERSSDNNEYGGGGEGETSIAETSKDNADVTAIFKDVIAWVDKDCQEYDTVVSCVTSLGGRVVEDDLDENITHFIVQRIIPNVEARLPRVEIVCPSWVFACQSSLTLVDTNQHKPQPKASSKSMQALRNMLTDGDDDISNDSVGPSHCPPPKPKRSSNSNLRLDQEQINPEELDAPHIVWDNNDDSGSDARQRQLAAVTGKENRVKDTIKAKVSVEPGSSKMQRRNRNRPDTESDDEVADVSPHKLLPIAGTLEKQLPNPFRVEIPSCPSFMLSGLNEDQKQESSEIITSLGGRLLTTSEFDPKTFGIIASSLARSEKVLGCIASGKCLIKYSYLQDCKKAKKFLPLTDNYLWQKKDGTAQMEGEIAQAAYRWLLRCMKNPDNKPMSDLNIYLVETNAIKRAAYSRLIHVGGGTVTTEPEEATVIIADVKSKNVPKIVNVAIKPALFLNQLILDDGAKASLNLKV